FDLTDRQFVAISEAGQEAALKGHRFAKLAEERGGELIRVGRNFPSSKRCSCCGRIREDMTLADRIYICDCGNVKDRDVNAAINIRLEAMRLKSLVNS
ncbi:MAG: transposase, partial [Mogibacterium sp.]|nr:transposase [Mogibacterium sp.]